jgi:hypothetical protein
MCGDLQKHLRVIYSRKVNDRVTASVCQCQDPDGWRSQFLALHIHDGQSGRWIVLRLSTFRRIVKYLDEKDMLVARHLTWVERLKISSKEMQESIRQKLKDWGSKKPISPVPPVPAPGSTVHVCPQCKARFHEV